MTASQGKQIRDESVEVSHENVEKPSKAILKKVADHSKNKATIMHYLGVGLWLGWFGFYAYLPIIMGVLWFYYKPGFIGMIVFLVVAHFLPINRKLQPAICYKLGANLMHKAADYFKMQIWCEDYDVVNNSGPAIWSIEPHDVLPLGLFCMSDYLGYFPGHKMIGCLTSACFLIPGMKHVYTWADAYSVEKKSLQKLIASGHSPTICPGGAMEVSFLNHKPECTMYIKKRLGLVRLAMQYGVPIIPTVAFNQRDAFSFYVPKGRLLQKLGRMMGFMPILITGVFNIPFAQPKPRSLQVVVGKPIPIPKIEGKPSDEELHKYHAQFVAATTRLFEDHKEQFGMGNIELIVR